ncbi:hypothetical protein [Neisseria sicca]|uniref:hypothetical protein n=1 Tax=Neisseria sicca TaxID=490 RepID=UPI001649BF7F|nr:hypothetical protein [Neisseria sicca]
MQAQRDVGRLGHGKIGVNNKRRIVAGLEKGRLKRSVAGFAKTNKVSFQTTLKEKWYINRKNFLFYLNFIKNKIKTD